MSKRHILDHILQKPIEHLKVTKQSPPNREVLKLYREVLKFSYQFDWNNKQGDNWGEVLRKSARKEFDIARNETDSLIVMKMIMTTREAMHKTREKMNEAFFTLNQTIEKTKNEQK